MKNDMRSYAILRKMRFVSLINALLIFKDGGFKAIYRKITKKDQNVLAKRKNDLLKNGSISIVFDKSINLDELKNVLKKYNYNFNFIKLVKNYHNNCEQEIKEITIKDFEKTMTYYSCLYLAKNQTIIKECFNIIPLKFDSKFEINLDKLLSSIQSVKLLANYTDKNNISVKTSTFYDYNGSNYYSGGAERYLIDLYELCAELGLNLNIYQAANKPFVRKYRNINVFGLALKNREVKFNNDYISCVSRNYVNSSLPTSQLHIYSAFQECYPYHVSPSIGISHGVSWDHKFCRADDPMVFWREKEQFIVSAKMCDKLISVDTNTANWFQTIDYKLGNQKFEVIYNYVDTKEFCPRDNYQKLGSKIIITYPRRLYEPRGLYIALETADKLLSKYDNIEFHFVGKGFDEDLKKIEIYQKKWKNRILCYSKDPKDMPEVYKQSDISLIPTLYSEGTSLSCLEAMASGNLVIATRIGGLTDLIIDSFNGFLIEPNADALYKKLDKVIANYDEYIKLKEYAIISAKTFNKNIWKNHWKEVIKSFDLKNKSNNIPLVEFYVNDVTKLSLDILNKIKEEVSMNKLIYIRSKKMPKIDEISGGLIQLINYDEEIINEAEMVYIEKNIKDINRIEKITRI